MAQQDPRRSSRRSAHRSSGPSQPSSVTVLLRALVMLACLVVIPLAALFGTKLPGIVQGFRHGGWPAATESARQALSEAPPYRPPAVDPSGGFRQAPAWAPNAEVPPSPPAPSGFAIQPSEVVQGYRATESARARTPPHDQPQAIRPASAFPPAGPVAAEQGPMLASYESRVDPPRLGLGGRTRPPGGGGPTPPGHPAGWTQSPPEQPAGALGQPQPTPTVDRFTYIQQRLRQLGATYYLLESWGSEGQYFRFHCRIGVGGNEDYTRHFEATETDAIEAMARVLREVETWRAGW